MKFIAMVYLIHTKTTHAQHMFTNFTTHSFLPQSQSTVF